MITTGSEIKKLIGPNNFHHHATLPIISSLLIKILNSNLPD